MLENKAIYFCQHEAEFGFDNISKIYLEFRIAQQQKIITFHSFDKMEGNEILLKVMAHGQSLGHYALHYGEKLAKTKKPCAT